MNESYSNDTNTNATCAEVTQPMDESLFAGLNFSLGVTVGRHHKSGEDVFQLNSDRFRHTLILGRTGAGKSNHIQRMEREDIRNGAGVFILAAHEDDALYALSCVSEYRLGDVVFIDATNPEYLPCMNPLDVDVRDRSAVDKRMNDIIELITMDSRLDWAGPRFESYFRNGISLLLSVACPYEHSFTELHRLYTDPEYVKELLASCTERDVYDHWTRVIPQSMKSSDSGEVVDWFVSKVVRFANDRTLRHIFGPGRATIDMQRVVDEGKIFIAYVPESRLGSIAARTMSKWLIMQLRDAIMNRRGTVDACRGINLWRYVDRCASAGEGAVKPFFVYVDEFAKFVSPDFEVLLAEARKHHVGFVLSTQTLAQTRVLNIRDYDPEKLGQVILGNVGSFICYPMGESDVGLLARQLDVDEDVLKRVRRYRPLVRLCMNNQSGRVTALEVDVRPDPEDALAPVRVARNMIYSGQWCEVEDSSGDGFLLMLNSTLAEAGIGDLEKEEDNNSPDALTGIGCAYRYRDPKTGLFEMTCDGDKAGCLASRGYDIIKVRYSWGLVERIYLPERLGGRKEPERVEKRDGEHAFASASKPAPRRLQNGLGIACRYVDFDTDEEGWVNDCTEAPISASCEDVWVVFEHGKIVRPATAEEYQEELEVRIGERISEGLPEELLDEFDRIDDPDEATAWLERNRPDYREIVEEENRKMKAAIVLDG